MHAKPKLTAAPDEVFFTKVVALSRRNPAVAHKLHEVLNGLSDTEHRVLCLRYGIPYFRERRSKPR